MDVLAVDVGASSGRAMVGKIRNDTITLEEVHRFPNEPVFFARHMYWDMLNIIKGVKDSVVKACRENNLISIGIDTWGNDFGLIDRSGELIGQVHHYRDSRTQRALDKVFAAFERRDLYMRTGIQFMVFNAIFQLVALAHENPDQLDRANKLLLIPDLIRYALTGEQVTEWTNATTTSLVNAGTSSWDRELFNRLGLPLSIMAPLIKPGTPVGSLLPEVQSELGVPAIPLLAVGEHDTASAVAAVPADDAFIYIICGTWTLIGTETQSPILNEKSFSLNFTNEGGVEQKNRFLKNTMGMWILERCRRCFTLSGQPLDYSFINSQVEAAEKFRSLVDPDHPSFHSPNDMLKALQNYCKRTQQPIPETIGQVFRCIYESFALKYRVIVKDIEVILNREVPNIYMVGGPTRNIVLCQMITESLGRRLKVGPSECSVLGNMLVQWIAHGAISDLRHGRAMIRESFAVIDYHPRSHDEWENAISRYETLLHQDL